MDTPEAASKHVPETAIDYDEVLSRGGRNLGDEDFALFKCPNCCHVYLMEYEVDTVYLDGADLAKRDDQFGPERPFTCMACTLPLPVGAWVGPHAEERFKVTWAELEGSAWAWVANPPDVGDQS